MACWSLAWHVDDLWQTRKFAEITCSEVLALTVVISTFLKKRTDAISCQRSHIHMQVDFWSIDEWTQMTVNSYCKALQMTKAMRGLIVGCIASMCRKTIASADKNQCNYTVCPTGTYLPYFFTLPLKLLLRLKAPSIGSSFSMASLIASARVLVDSVYNEVTLPDLPALPVLPACINGSPISLKTIESNVWGKDRHAEILLLVTKQVYQSFWIWCILMWSGSKWFSPTPALLRLLFSSRKTRQDKCTINSQDCSKFTRNSKERIDYTA